MIKLFLKRILGNKIYWVVVAAAFLLLLCSIVYTDPMSGEPYTFLSLYYNEEMKIVLQFGGISVKDILLGSCANYLWMFAPIITGIPCVLTQETERFVLFRANKNRYFLSKYISNLIAGGLIMVSAYLLFALAGVFLILGLQDWSELLEQIWNVDFLKKLLSVFCWGILNAIWGILLSEYIKNKYLILCIPFVWNYFLMHFLQPLLPLNIRSYVSLSDYAMLFLRDTQTMIVKILVLLFLLLGCGLLMKFTIERRCDCGQK